MTAGKDEDFGRWVPTRCVLTRPDYPDVVTMSILASRERALNHKQTVLQTSLESWLEATAGKETRQEPAYEIHYTQTREVDHLMTGLRKLVEDTIKGVSEGNVLERSASIEEKAQGRNFGPGSRSIAVGS